MHFNIVLQSVIHYTTYFGEKQVENMHNFKKKYMKTAKYAHKAYKVDVYAYKYT